MAATGARAVAGTTATPHGIQDMLGSLLSVVHFEEPPALEQLAVLRATFPDLGALLPTALAMLDALHGGSRARCPLAAASPTSRAAPRRVADVEPTVHALPAGGDVGHTIFCLLPSSLREGVKRRAETVIS